MAYPTYIQGLPSKPNLSAAGSAAGAVGSSGFGNVASGASAGATVGGPWGAVIGGAAGLVSSALSSKGAKKSAETQQRAAQEAIAYQREQDAKEEARYREQIEREEAQWNAEQQRIAPYREAAEALLMQNAGRLGLSGVRPSSRTPPMPSGWSGSTVKPPRTLSSLAGMSSNQGPDAVFGVPAVASPQMTISDVLSNRWGGR